MTTSLTHPRLAPIERRGHESFEGTESLRSQLPAIFAKYNIQSVFDVGCNDCQWAKEMSQYATYRAGDIQQDVVEWVQAHWPDVNIQQFNALTDQYPKVDVVFARNLAIHFNTAGKKQFLLNWLSSGTPWIMMTHEPGWWNDDDFEPIPGVLQTSVPNWEVAPWNFPPPTAVAHDPVGKPRTMSLWHRDQIINLL